MTFSWLLYVYKYPYLLNFHLSCSIMSSEQHSQKDSLLDPFAAMLLTFPFLLSDSFSAAHAPYPVLLMSCFNVFPLVSIKIVQQLMGQEK